MWKSLSHVRLCDPMEYRVHGILQARILEWVAFPFSRGSSQTRDQNQVSCIAGGFFTSWATRETFNLKWPPKQNKSSACSSGDIITSSLLPHRLRSFQILLKTLTVDLLSNRTKFPKEWCERGLTGGPWGRDRRVPVFWNKHCSIA